MRISTRRPFRATGTPVTAVLRIVKIIAWVPRIPDYDSFNRRGDWMARRLRCFWRAREPVDRRLEEAGEIPSGTVHARLIHRRLDPLAQFRVIHVQKVEFSSLSDKE
ncbi:hypothetical protein FB45DRAFT_1067711 [Roridomyces roridus]|uniref:Uncharacterized protein n=1 Tax=Roridomyces roridus TaxID=1738132 RepID=A0AAD7B2M9_9AGAR|nr:hypothetical protein FB45DRAFT_1067711 [Roridomyces roridus]